MESVQFKKLEIWLKEILCSPYYIFLAISIFILANENLIITLISFLIGWYLISLIYWQLYKHFVLAKAKNGHLKLYSYLFTLQALLCSILLYTVEL